MAILLASCDPFFNCIEGNGIIKTEQRVVAVFYGVVNNTNYNVDIVYDSIYSVNITADENLLPYINTIVRSGDLVIEVDNDRCLEESNNIIIDIRMPYLELIELNGSGNIDIDEFDCNNVEIINNGSGSIDFYGLISISTVGIALNGSGSITVIGKAHRGNLNLSGSANIWADDFRVDDCYATNSGSGNIFCFAYDLLDATVTGSGDIIYYGSPIHVVETDNGSGEIRSWN